MDFVLEFERPIVELEKRIAALHQVEIADGTDLSEAIGQLRVQSQRLQAQIFSHLSPWQRTLLSRHPARPYTLDYIGRLFTEWTELHGDRTGHDDPAIVAGFARLDGIPVAVVGHQKGRGTKDNLYRNFGSPRPEGFRKALRVMQLAERFGRPVVTFIDTQGAYPGVDAEERGQAEAIARSIMEMSAFRVPVICCVIGEGGSGGALAIGVGNRVLMMEYAIYSVISPEGCAAILWRDRAEGPQAAEALRITAPDCLDNGIIEEIIMEPPGGAHRDPDAAIDALGGALRRHLDELMRLSPDQLRQDRYRRFRGMGFTQTQEG